MGLPALKTLRGNVPRGGDVHRGEIVPRGGNVPRGVMFLAGDVPRGVVVTAVWLSPRCGYPPRCGCSRGVVVLAVGCWRGGRRYPSVPLPCMHLPIPAGTPHRAPPVPVRLRAERRRQRGRISHRAQGLKAARPAVTNGQQLQDLRG